MPFFSEKNTTLGLFFSCLCWYMREASTSLLLLMLWVVLPIHTISKIKEPNLRMTYMVVGLSLSKEEGCCEYLGGQIYRGTKRTESFRLGPLQVLSSEHIAINPTMLMWWNFTFPEFSPLFPSLENTGCKGMRAFAAPWYLTCTKMSISTAWQCRGISVQPAKAERILSLTLMLYCQENGKSLFCAVLSCFKSRGNIVLSITSAKCP